VLRRVSIHVSPGEIVTIIGANGAGKTTLLQTIAGLLRAQAGEILFDKQDIGRHAPEGIAFLGCALVPEGRQVFAPMTVSENLQLGAYVQIRRGRGHEVQHDLGRVFDLFPRLQERASQLAGTLSGGEQQMLAIGRALMARPKLIMMDEPSMGLAPLVVKDIFAIIRRLGSEGTGERLHRNHVPTHAEGRNRRDDLGRGSDERTFAANRVGSGRRPQKVRGQNCAEEPEDEGRVGWLRG